MDFQRSDEQRALADSFARFIADQYDAPGRAARLAMPGGFDPQGWRALAELGLVALPLDEADAGLGLGLTDLMVAMEALGPGLLLDPWLPTLIVARLVSRLGDEAQKESWLPGLISGEAVLAFAYTEPQGGQLLSYCATVATKTQGGYVLDGAKMAVLGAGADAVLVLARTGGEVASARGLSLFIISTDQAGLTSRDYRLVDGGGARELRFDGCRIAASTRLGEEGAAFAPVEDAIAEACVALCGEAIGIMDAAMAATIEHLRTRRQFGAALASFQAIQHRMADAAAALELARGVALRAAMLGDDPDTPRAARLIAAFSAKALTARTARHVAEETVQFHGAIGITEELWVGRAMKRLLLIAGLFGDERTMTQRCDVLRREGEAG